MPWKDLCSRRVAKEAHFLQVHFIVIGFQFCFTETLMIISMRLHSFVRIEKLSSFSNLKSLIPPCP